MNDTDHENQAEAQRYYHLRLEAVRDALSDSAKQDALMEDCLVIESQIAVDIQLSTGGPRRRI